VGPDRLVAASPALDDDLMFCGVRREDDAAPFRVASERVRLYSRPGNDLTKRLDQDEEPRLRGALKREGYDRLGDEHGQHAAFDPDSARRLCCRCDRRRAFVSGRGNGL
jgi:hypothetical protein